jgi:thiamine biosynthesis lipoprotein
VPTSAARQVTDDGAPWRITTTTRDAVARSRFRALGTTVDLLVTDPGQISVAEAILRAELAAVDEACSRFRADSEVSLLRHRSGPSTISPLLTEVLRVALRAAALTGGRVDPTVGRAVEHLGYDRDFDDLDRHSPTPVLPHGPVPGWRRVRLDAARCRIVLPHGILLDLGVTAKALIADRASTTAALATGCGVLVGLGGDLAAAGRPPRDGWRVAVGQDHTRGPVLGIVSGGLATSSTTARTWCRGGRRLHHIVDPRTGDIPAPVWRTVSVTAPTCVDANTASTAAILLGHAAVDWLADRGLPARLVAVDGTVRTVAGWPDDPPRRSDPCPR